MRGRREGIDGDGDVELVRTHVVDCLLALQSPMIVRSIFLVKRDTRLWIPPRRFLLTMLTTDARIPCDAVANSFHTKQVYLTH